MPLDIRAVDWVDLRWHSDRSGFYRMLEFGGGEGWRRFYPLRWWGGWRRLVRWLVRHHATVDPLGQPVWDVEMPPKAQPKFDRFARKYLSGS